MKKPKEVRKKSLLYQNKKPIILTLTLMVLIILSLILTNSYFKFKSGEFVYKENEEGTKIGIINGINLLRAKYLVKWQDKEITEESPNKLKKLSSLENKDQEILYPHENSRNTSEESSLENIENYNFTILRDSNKEYFSDEQRGFISTIIESIQRVSPGKFQSESKNQEACLPEFICSEESPCKANYSINQIMQDNLSFNGFKERICIDLNSCLPKRIIKTECALRENITFKKTFEDNILYLDIYSKNTNELLSKLKFSEKNISNMEVNLPKLDITFRI